MLRRNDDCGGGPTGQDPTTMDADTALAIMATLDEAEDLLSRLRLHDGPLDQDSLLRNRELLDLARYRLETASRMA
ncbi:hypothetical protein [Azospirillum thermophilum]|uniref:Uncharacterized protein n=1 Tax=Azospirillum thermophilum TaxID=2202148 RepID=A0A2S2CRV8_9PROT|nr:hypothetical protein [Azospirillum thermophilum]AWK87110.1 hypothetical protein DEW08_13540 [Azospirillum thermophilum]